MYFTTSFLSFPLLVALWTLDAVLLLIAVRLVDKRWAVLPTKVSTAIRDLTDPLILSAESSFHRLGVLRGAKTYPSRWGWFIVLLGAMFLRVIIIRLIWAIS
ncbi:MAG: hypothetical protein B6D36_04445 [Planctomycetes bacterium UTPLA1]|jgi:hypothetical protein|nr:MAG: hypothetical protein B6D36_04445 [Planctomycetes bacterium UTPLA1]